MPQTQDEENLDWWRDNPGFHKNFEILEIPIEWVTPFKGCRWRVMLTLRSGIVSYRYFPTSTEAVWFVWNTAGDWGWTLSENEN